MLDKQGQDRDELLLGELVAERVQVLDGVDNQDGVNSSRGGLEVREDVLAKEVDNVNKDVDGGYSALGVSSHATVLSSPGPSSHEKR